jgi:hypothetical protein
MLCPIRALEVLERLPVELFCLPVLHLTVENGRESREIGCHRRMLGSKCATSDSHRLSSVGLTTREVTRRMLKASKIVINIRQRDLVGAALPFSGS